jgi:hypothetical protein
MRREWPWKEGAGVIGFFVKNCEDVIIQVESSSYPSVEDPGCPSPFHVLPVTARSRRLSTPSSTRMTRASTPRRSRDIDLEICLENTVLNLTSLFEYGKIRIKKKCYFTFSNWNRKRTENFIHRRAAGALLHCQHQRGLPRQREAGPDELLTPEWAHQRDPGRRAAGNGEGVLTPAKEIHIFEGQKRYNSRKLQAGAVTATSE